MVRGATPIAEPTAPDGSAEEKATPGRKEVYNTRSRCLQELGAIVAAGGAAGRDDAPARAPWELPGATPGHTDRSAGHW